MEVIFDLESENPSVTARFGDLDDLICFLAGFWEVLIDG